ncbi:hypothetical protein EW146_g4169, partial [Bondarzewia mesenterica]
MSAAFSAKRLRAQTLSVCTQGSNAAASISAPPTPRTRAHARTPVHSAHPSSTTVCPSPRLLSPLSPLTLPVPPNTPHPKPLPATSTATQITPRVYISDLSTAEDPTLLSKLGITHVLSVMPGSIHLPAYLAADPSRTFQLAIQDAP